jgi:hypothetical protein
MDSSSFEAFGAGYTPLGLVGILGPGSAGLVSPSGSRFLPPNRSHHVGMVDILIGMLPERVMHPMVLRRSHDLNCNLVAGFCCRVLWAAEGYQARNFPRTLNPLTLLVLLDLAVPSRWETANRRLEHRNLHGLWL